MKKFLCKLLVCDCEISLLARAAAVLRRKMRNGDTVYLSEWFRPTGHHYTINIFRQNGLWFLVEFEPDLGVAVDKILQSYRESL